MYPFFKSYNFFPAVFDSVLPLLQTFIFANSNVAIKSPNLSSSVIDEPQALIDYARNRLFEGVLALHSSAEIPSATDNLHDSVAIAVVSTMKIISRKDINRVNIGADILQFIVEVLKVASKSVVAASSAHSSRQRVLARECCNCVLNLCYESGNVTLLLELDGVSTLLLLLSCHDDADLLSSAYEQKKAVQIESVRSLSAPVWVPCKAYVFNRLARRASSKPVAPSASSRCFTLPTSVL